MKGIRSFLMVLIMVALTLLVMPILHMDVPYLAYKQDHYFASIAERKPSESWPFEILSISCGKPTPGIIVFEITIRARERILWLWVDISHLSYNVTMTTHPHETYPQYDEDLFPSEEKTFGVVAEITLRMRM